MNTSVYLLSPYPCDYLAWFNNAYWTTMNLAKTRSWCWSAERKERIFVGGNIGQYHDDTTIHLQCNVDTIVSFVAKTFALRRIANQIAGRPNDIVSYGLLSPSLPVPVYFILVLILVRVASFRRRPREEIHYYFAYLSFASSSFAGCDSCVINRSCGVQLPMPTSSDYPCTLSSNW